MSIYSTGINPLQLQINNTSNFVLSTSNILEQNPSNNIAISANFLQTQITNTCNLIY